MCPPLGTNREIAELGRKTRNREMASCGANSADRSLFSPDIRQANFRRIENPQILAQNGAPGWT
jgi:hypothetical protein